MYFNEVFEIINEGINLALSYFIDTEKRIHILYLFSSLLLAFFIYKKTKIKGSFWKYIFNKRIWLSTSALIDYGLFIFNSFLKILLLAPYVVFGLYIAFYTNEMLLQGFGFPQSSLNVTLTIILYTITLTIINDFSVFIVHYLLHKVPILWEFHKIHHSATTLNPFTQYRIHPIELIINNIRSIVVFGLITGLFDYLSAHQINKLVFLGVNVFSFIFLLFGANLRHSHVKLRYPKIIEYLLISPYQHQIHHSDNPKHFNKNMGSKLAIWDWMFGTLVLSKSASKIKFGIGKETKKYNSLLSNLWNPFKNILQIITRNKQRT